MKHLRKFKQFESKIFYNTDSTDYDTQEEYTEKMPSYYDYKNGKITEKDFPNINPKVKNMHLKDKINLNDLETLNDYIENVDYFESSFVLHRLKFKHDEVTTNPTLIPTWKKMVNKWYKQHKDIIVQN